MRKIIDGKIYDTDTATEVCDITPLSAAALSRSDFGWENTTLYRTPKGQFFIAGEGGARSRWSQAIGNGSQGGSGLDLVSIDDAKKLVEHFGTPETYTQLFGKPEEG